MAVFLTKKQREELKLKQQIEADYLQQQAQLEVEEHRKILFAQRNSRPERQRSRSREKESPKPQFLIDNKEVEMIKQQHLGQVPQRAAKRVSNDKQRMDFKDQWDASEDTSIDLNPLFSQRKDPKLLFGKGSIGGVDPALQGTQRMDTAMRNFMLKKESIETKSKEVFSERDWRILRENNGILIKGGHCPNPIREWKDLQDLPREVRYNLEDNGFTKPMPIQMQAVPIGMNMRDMIGLAPTGSGKSAAFLLPLISFLLKQPPIKGKLVEDGPYAMIMAPTRELAQQIEKEFVKLTMNTRLRSVVVVGGKSAEEQGSIISGGVEVIIGTPGRIEDCLDRRTLVLNQCYFVVLDEADKMIDYNFEDSIKKIFACIPPEIEKSTVESEVLKQEAQMALGHRNYKIFHMFSATMQPYVEKLAREYLRFPAFIQIVISESDKANIEQRIEFVNDSTRKTKLKQILDRFSQRPVIVFVNTKVDVDYICDFLVNARMKVTSLHGGKGQEQREKSLQALKSGSAEILVCTNVASRGIDIANVAHVINYHAPKEFIDYVHRIGRTGRAGKRGIATTFIDLKQDEAFVPELRNYLRESKQVVPHQIEDT